MLSWRGLQCISGVGSGVGGVAVRLSAFGRDLLTQFIRADNGGGRYPPPETSVHINETTRCQKPGDTLFHCLLLRGEGLMDTCSKF